MLLTMSICIISDSDNCHDHSSVVRNTLQQQQEDVTTSLKNLGCSCYILILKFEEQSTRIRRRNNFVMAKYNETSNIMLVLDFVVSHMNISSGWRLDSSLQCSQLFEGGVKLRKNSVFGPHTVSDEVYEVAAKLAVKAATEGVNGTIFAYGVTSSEYHTLRFGYTKLEKVKHADAPESCGLENSIANSADSPSSQPDSKLLAKI
ncbi:hypothetical protein P8452_42770 [Trifolium repens]|nr:hypothetical protein P8452_42770 [Trifolium repens]